jgi:type VI secretion system secreted protein Hcp
MLRNQAVRVVAVMVLSLAVLMVVFGGPTLSNSEISSASAASFEGFLKLDGIQGESQDRTHASEIEVLSYSEGQDLPLARATNSGKVKFSDIKFRHSIDKASVSLSMFCASGKHIKTATFSFRKAGKDQQDFYKVKLTDVIITSTQRVVGTVAQGPLSFEKLEASTGAPGISEEVSLSFNKIEWEYVPQKADGSRDTSIKGAWDMRANKGDNSPETSTEAE